MLFFFFKAYTNIWNILDYFLCTQRVGTLYELFSAVPWDLQPCTSQRSFLQLLLWLLDPYMINSLLKFLLHSLFLVWHFILDLIIFFYFSFIFSEFLSKLFTKLLILFSVEYSVLFSAAIGLLSLQFCNYVFFSPHFFLLSQYPLELCWKNDSSIWVTSFELLNFIVWSIFWFICLLIIIEGDLSSPSTSLPSLAIDYIHPPWMLSDFWGI